MNNVREIRQGEAKEAWLNSNRKSAILACPRFGKILTSIRIMKELGTKKVLISFPRTDIIDGWKADFKKWKFDIEVEWTTFRSVGKKMNEQYDLLIIDEVHECSVNQLMAIEPLVSKIPTLALSGTITGKTEKEMAKYAGIDICYTYPIEKGVEEGILCDYDIYVHEVDLDDSKKIYSGKKKTEKKYFSDVSFRRDGMDDKLQKWYMELKMISILQNSLGKIKETRRLINEYEDQRLLVFTGLTEVANQFEIPVYHSKSRDKQLFQDFCNGINYKHLATVNMMNAGVTIKPIDRGIFNYLSGAPEQTTQRLCRFLGLEYDRSDKKAQLHIVTSSEKFEKNKLHTALSFFDNNKISWV